MSAVVREDFSYESLSPSEKIVDLMQRRIQRYLDSRSDPDLYQSLRNMSEFVSDDYGNRFLIELIQNAHDAHDRDRSDGEIAIVLDTSDGPHGCLYVANRGSGFTWNNVKAISNIALSSKPVNAGIGNKGIGFRSVLQICTWPEIYSTNGIAGTGKFDGYCFRFATEDDLHGLLEPYRLDGLSASDLAREMADNMPCWHVPLPADQPHGIIRFAASGFATVVRLPLKSNHAQLLVRAEIDRLTEPQPPLHLFLNRIERITISCGEIGETSMERKVLNKWSIQPQGWKADAPVEYTHLQMGSETFLLVEWDIDEDPFREALEASRSKKEIPDSWSKWEGHARVSVAVPLGYSIDIGRLYCFLPLGNEGKAPFAGYINANFYTKMDRRTVNEAIELNRFFLQMAAWVSCRAVEFLIERNWPQAPMSVVSLLCWDHAYLQQLRHSFGEDGNGILTRPLLPVRGRRNTVCWAPASSAIGWNSAPDAWLSPQNLCEVAEASVLLDCLTTTQRNALDRLYQDLRGSGFAPTPAIVAEWIEKIAIHSHASGIPEEKWGTFYDEIANALAGHPEALFGKRFLLNVNGDLIVSDPASRTLRGRRAADVYFSPVTAADADADDAENKRALPLEEMPARLRSGFALLSRNVPWSIDGGPRPGRLFLVAGKLAREYDTGDVIRTLASVTRAEVADSTRLQALEWSFRLWNSARSLSDKETKGARFHLPTGTGWLPAEFAIFGAGWSVDNGKRLETFLRRAEVHSRDLEQARTHLLPAFENWPIRVGAEADWIHFLTAAGATDCLRPTGGEELVPERRGVPQSLAWSIAGLMSGTDKALSESWRDLMSQAARNMYISRVYRGEVAAWRLPGQSEAVHFPTELRRDFAVQVARSIRSLTSEHCEFRVVRADTGAIASEVHRWPTPLYAYLTRGEWLPVAHPGTTISFVPPNQAWHFQEDEERPPRFIEFVVPQVARALDVSTLQWLCKHGSLGVFNNDQYAQRALAAMTAAAAHGISDMRDVRRFSDLFRRLWLRAKELGQELAPSDCVPVRHEGSITVVHKTGGTLASGHLDDQHDTFRTQLLEELGAAVFDFVPTDVAGVWEWIVASVPDRFKRISSETLEVFLDGEKFDEASPWPLLTEILGGWIVDFLVCVAEHKGGSFVRATQSTLGRLRRTALSLRIAFAEEIQISHGGHQRALPPFLRGAMVLPTQQGPVLAMQVSRASFDLDRLAAMAGHVAAALSMRELAHGLEAGLLRLAKLQGDTVSEPPGDDTIAEALGVERDSILKTRELASGDLQGLLYFALPLAACLSTPQVLEPLLHLASDEEQPAHDTLHAAFDALATDIGIPLPTLEHRLASVNDMHDLMAEFALPIDSLNAALAQLGGAYKTVSNEARHQEQWNRYLRLQLTVVVEQVRQRTAGCFDRRESLQTYTTARDTVLTIAPDTGWFTRYDELPEPAMVEQIGRWLTEQVPSDPTQYPLELTLHECRTTNNSRLRDFWDRFGPLLSTWVRAQPSEASAEVRQAWHNPTLTREGYAARARAHGWLDFRALDDEAIAQWLTRDGIWPSARPAIADPLAWGLTPDAVLNSTQRAEKEREEEQRRRSEVTFGGKAYSGHKEAYVDIAAVVAAAIANAPALSKVTRAESALNDMAPSNSASGKSSSGGGTHTPPENAMSDIQKQAVGLLGELWAKEWIRRRHGLEAVDESIWVSTYRDSVLGVSGGLNTLGYDFVVATKRRTYYYEVKASTGDPQRFEIGPTEIIAAQRFRSDREHRYRILYVAHAGDPARARIRLLLNPFSVRGETKFRMVGKGSVTYEFDPA